MIEQPYPELEELLVAIGEAGLRLSEIEASEGSAGNISVYIGWPIETRRRFSNQDKLEFPIAVPHLAGGTLLVTGSGRRLREVIRDPTANLGVVIVDEGGRTGRLYTSPRRLFVNLTSEFNSHLAIHNDQVLVSSTNFHTVIHAQPMHLTYISHITRYQDEAYLNQHLLRWQPETIVNLPEGIGVLPFILPGSAELMAANIEALRKHRIVIWGKHGVIVRSDTSIKRASDRIEYAETGARYEYMNLMCGEPGEGLNASEIRLICQKFNITQSIF
jgi:rhamnulose-1-phosphate aldolase